jgi:hypothetical protein
MSLSEKVINNLTNVLKAQAQKQKAELKISNKRNVFGGRIKSNRGTIEVDVIFDDNTAFIHLSNGLFSSKEDYHCACLSDEDYEKESSKIEQYINDCFKLKLVKK